MSRDAQGTTGSKAPDAVQNLPEVSVVRDDWPFRVQRRVGLIPRQGLGTVRRALFLALLTWLPIALWAWIRQRALPGTVPEPLLEHFALHIRCLVAIPLFVVAESVAHGVTTRLFPHFLTSGLVKEEDRGRFQGIVERLLRLRSQTLPWVFLLGLVVAWTAMAPVVTELHGLVWAGEPDGTFGFGGQWFLYVARPVFIAFVVAWLWRYGLIVLLLFRISRLDLSVVPTHPDRAGGLGFLEGLPNAFSLVILACSAVIAGTWAHEEVYHGVSLPSLRLPMAAFVVLLLALFLAPLLLFGPILRKARRRALLDYGALLAEHGRLVHRRWILGERLETNELLTAPELGPVADTLSLYGAVRNMRSAPIGKAAVLAIAVPAVLPIVVVIAIKIPIKDLLLKILKALA